MSTKEAAFSVSRLMQTARSVAMRHGVDPSLFMALCEHESAGWKWAATRFEPAFYARYVSPEKMPTVQTFGLVSKDTERKDRATSFGLGQIMGQTAREFGFKGEFLSELLDPELGCEYACKKLKQCLDEKGDERAALLRYNGGNNPAYPDLVLRHRSKYQ